jgi:hypothetical protein
MPQILLMSGMPPSHFDDFLSEFAHLRVGVLEKPFSLETLRRKLVHIQGNRRLSGTLPRVLPPVANGNGNGHGPVSPALDQTGTLSDVKNGTVG